MAADAGVVRIPVVPAVFEQPALGPPVPAVALECLALEKGVCFIQTGDDCTDSLLKVPQLLVVRPRCTRHGGQTTRSDSESGQPTGLPDNDKP